MRSSGAGEEGGGEDVQPADTSRATSRPGKEAGFPLRTRKGFVGGADRVQWWVQLSLWSLCEKRLEGKHTREAIALVQGDGAGVCRPGEEKRVGAGCGQK